MNCINSCLTDYRPGIIYYNFNQIVSIDTITKEIMKKRVSKKFLQLVIKEIIPNSNNPISILDELCLKNFELLDYYPNDYITS
jgi:hypothetical protein